ncbi:MAG: gluconate 2-dehydrogenase subunit 3 family protein [Bacteroidota bacterium]
MKRRNALKNTAVLAGSAVLFPSLATLLQSCQNQPRISWQPTFLSVDHTELLATLVDTILPKTDTPGGLDVKVDMFMDLVFSKLYNDEGQKSIVADLNAFDEKCQSKYSKNFVNLTTDQRHELLMAEEKSNAKFNGGVWGTAVGKQAPVGFYRRMKSLALWGYFTSEEIGSEVLNYDPVPGEYRGCVPLEEVGNQWS